MDPIFLVTLQFPFVHLEQFYGKWDNEYCMFLWKWQENAREATADKLLEKIH